MRDVSRHGDMPQQEPKTEHPHMPNVTAILKQEISRIAKKEAKSFFKDLPSSFGSLKRTVSEQKKRITALEAKVAKLEKSIAKDSKLSLPKPEELEHSRLGASNVVKLRKKLGITRAEMAKLVGSSTNSVFLWENGKATPRSQAKSKIIALRGLGKREIKKLLGEQEPKIEAKTVAATAKPAIKRKKARKAKVLSKVSSEVPAKPAKEVKKPAKKAKKTAKKKSSKPVELTSSATTAATEAAGESSKA